jgi:phytoene dehydrogenase-like protein
VTGPGRIVVIGSGPNGLVCAERLASAGLRVLVVEGADCPGGGVRSGEATLPGFIHDHCAGFFPLTAASPAFRPLRLEDRDLEWINPSVPMAHPFADGRAISLHRGVAATAASLDAVAPGAGEGWREIIDPLHRHGALVVDAALARFPPLRAGSLLGLRLGRSGIALARLLLGSAAGFGRAVFADERPAAWLAGSTVHSDLDPGATGGAAFGVILHLLGHLVGWPFPRGGAGRITQALVSRIEAAGGSVRCRAPVEQILCNRARAAGVRLASGEELEADAVVATTSLGPFLSLLPRDALPGRIERRLRRWRYGIGTFKLDLALSGPVPWISEDARRAAVVQLGDTLTDQFRASQEARMGRVPSRPTMVIGQHSRHDQTRAPPGQHTLYAYTHLPQRPEIPDDEIVDRMERRIEQFAPGFRGLALARAHRSPLDLERENPSLVGGDLAGGSVELDQQLIFRPDPALFRYRTPLRGGYFAGASAHPGPGVHGVSGAGAARAVIADRSRLRRWRRPR